MCEICIATNNIIANPLLEISVTIDFKHGMQEFCSHILTQPQTASSTFGKIIAN